MAFGDIGGIVPIGSSSPRWRMPGGLPTAMFRLEAAAIDMSRSSSSGWGPSGAECAPDPPTVTAGRPRAAARRT